MEENLMYEAGQWKKAEEEKYHPSIWERIRCKLGGHTFSRIGTKCLVCGYKLHNRWNDYKKSTK